ncbi:MAG: SsrA-binding protein SmpB [Desulfomicrobium escambiense]|nr:SsrA-binding protein SmpB [Desulfomicrobium escambiense]
MTQLIAKNKKAFHEYFVEDSFEAGVVLLGTEVKSIREGPDQFQGCVLRLPKRRALSSSVSHHALLTWGRLQPRARAGRKLLLHRRELRKLIGKIKEKGFTIVPISLYFKDGRVKMEIALVKGKKLHDKGTPCASEISTGKCSHDSKNARDRSSILPFATRSGDTKIPHGNVAFGQGSMNAPFHSLTDFMQRDEQRATC